MSAVSAPLTVVSGSPGAQASNAAVAAEASGAAAAIAGTAAVTGSLTQMFQQLLAAALIEQPQTSAATAASAQLPAMLESLTAQLAAATVPKSTTAGSGKTASDLEPADPTDIAAVAAALLAALQFTNGTPPPVSGGASAHVFDTASDAAPELTAALAQLLSSSAGSGSGGDAAKPGAPIASLPAPGDSTSVTSAVDTKASPAGALALPALIDAMKIPDDSLRGASADASSTQHVLERLGATTAAIIPQAANDNGAPNAAPPVERTVTVPMQHPAWTEAVASQVQWCVDQGVPSARLQITPEHLGPVEIRLELADGKVNVSFGASHAETRAALEQSIPRLRELMSGAGLSLGETSVQQQRRQESRNPAPQTQSAGALTADDGFVPLRRVLGLVDEYA